MKKRIRVLHILTSLAPGGAETNLLSLLRHFDRTQFRHAVAYGGSGALEQEYAGEGAQLIRLAAMPLGLRDLARALSIARQIETFSPDIVHSHLDIPNVITLAAMALMKARPRLILHFHGLGIVPSRCLPGRGLAHSVYNVLARLYRHADFGIAICRFQLPYLERVGLGSERVRLIPNGINLDNYPQVQPHAEGSAYRFVSVARFYPEKDHRALIAAFREVATQLPDARLVLVGEGPLRAGIEELGRALGLQDRVTFLGMRRDVAAVFADSDCFVLNSLWVLHQITILEAMRAGLPVIASGVGGIPDTAIDGQTGVLVPSADIQSLASAMLRLGVDRSQSMAMGRKGRLEVEKRFSNALMANHIEEVYIEVMREV